MARIRTIKPEFPQSESMGRVSREARLCFILLWTIADDAGRLRGNGRLLSGLLYPYDDDAKDHIDSWLDELANEKCIHRYEAEGDKYIEICGWATHQKIDRPSPSRIPEPTYPQAKPARRLARPREDSPPDLGPRKGSRKGPVEGDSRDDSREDTPRASRLANDWVLPEDWKTWAETERPDLDADSVAEQFRDYWVAKAGKDGRKLDWEATWRNWIRNQRQAKASAQPPPQPAAELWKPPPDLTPEEKAKAAEARRAAMTALKAVA